MYHFLSFVPEDAGELTDVRYRECRHHVLPVELCYPLLSTTVWEGARQTVAIYTYLEVVIAEETQIATSESLDGDFH